MKTSDDLLLLVDELKKAIEKDPENKYRIILNAVKSVKGTNKKERIKRLLGF